MAPAPIPLPMKEIHAAYLSGRTYRQLAEDYSTSSSTIRNHMKRWTQERGLVFPPRPTHQRPNRNSVRSDLIVGEILDCVKEYRIGQQDFARICGVTTNYLAQLMCGWKPRIDRAMAEKIMVGIEKIESGDAVWDYDYAMMPKMIRDRCARGHAYGGRRDPKTGRQHCVICFFDKERRYEDRRWWRDHQDHQEEKSA